MAGAVLLAEDRSSARVRSVFYALVTTAIVLAVTVSEWGAERFFSHVSRAASVLSDLAIVVILAFAFRAIHGRIERAIEEAFTRRRHEARKTLFALARSVTGFRDPDELLRRIVAAIDQCVGGHGSAVYLKREAYYAAASSFESPAPDVGADDALIATLCGASAPVATRECSLRAPGSMACPMLARGELVGFLALDASIEQLDADDRQTVMALAQSTGLALAILQPQLLDAAKRPGALAGNVPHEVATLVGRGRELERIAALLSARRIVCIKGTGGIGKSRLAIRAAAQAADRFMDGAWFIDLTGARDESDVLSSLAATLGIPQTAGKSHLRNVIEFISDRRMLTIFDNCEHVAAAVAGIATALLRVAPALTILATSRERLSISGEAVFEVPPLSLECAIDLFCERAGEVVPSLSCDQYREEITEIVQHLDGIPFAVELAAARLRVLSPRDLAKRIGNLFQMLTDGERTALPHRQTLRAMLDWSYALLSPVEQTLFARLAVFPATFTLDASADVCSDVNLRDDEIVGLLGHLVDKSLLQTEAGPFGQRFRLLESGRMYARECLAEDALSDVVRRHSQYYRDLTHGITRNPAAGRHDVGLEQLQLDIDNVYAALSQSLEDGDIATAVTLGEDLTHYWFHYTQLRTGREWLAKLLAHEGDMSPSQRAAIRFANACMLLFSDPVLALESASIAVSISRDIGDRRLSAQALGAAGNAHLSLGNYGEAERAYEQSATIYDDLSPENASLMRVNLANVLINFDETQLDRAQKLLEEALSRARRLGQKRRRGRHLGQHGATGARARTRRGRICAQPSKRRDRACVGRAPAGGRLALLARDLRNATGPAR